MATIQRTLITSKEVVDFGPEAGRLSSNVVAKHIRREEIHFARNWLGYDFYIDLINDSYDLDTVPEWVDGNTYADGDVVQCYGLLYESQAGSNTSQLTDTNSWTKISKMKTDNLAKLYEMFLREYLSYIVSAKAVEYMNPVGGQGLVEVDGDGIKTASIERQQKRERRTLTLADDILDNMAYWVLEQKYGAGVTDYDKCLIISQSKVIIKPRRKPRRIALKTLPVSGSQDTYLQSSINYGAVNNTPRAYTLKLLEKSYSDQQTNTMVWDLNNGNLFSLHIQGMVMVSQNGNLLEYGTHYTITDNTETNDELVINDNTHFAGANYFIRAISQA